MVLRGLGGLIYAFFDEGSKVGRRVGFPVGTSVGVRVGAGVMTSAGGVLGL